MDYVNKVRNLQCKPNGELPQSQAQHGSPLSIFFGAESEYEHELLTARTSRSGPTGVL